MEKKYKEIKAKILYYWFVSWYIQQNSLQYENIPTISIRGLEMNIPITIYMTIKFIKSEMNNEVKVEMSSNQKKIRGFSSFKVVSAKP